MLGRSSLRICTYIYHAKYHAHHPARFSSVEHHALRMNRVLLDVQLVDNELDKQQMQTFIMSSCHHDSLHLLDVQLFVNKLDIQHNMVHTKIT